MESFNCDLFQIECESESPTELDDTFQEVSIAIVLLKACVHERYREVTMRHVDQAVYHKWKMVILGARTKSFTEGEKAVCWSEDCWI